MVMYQYAKDFQNNLIHIQNYSKNSPNAGLLFCLSCSREMIARQGTQRDWHFAHKNDIVSGTCSQETYLHNTAKTILYENIKTRIENNGNFYLKFNRPVVCGKCHFPFSPYEDCTLASQVVSFDLLSKFKNVTVEKHVAGFQPDICLSGNDIKIFIEILVTHKVEQEKIDSGYRIIEIEIKSEADLIHLKTDTLDPTVLQINRYNFETKPIRRTIEPEECTRGNKRRFILYRSGKARVLPEISYSEVMKLPESAIYIADIPDEMEEAEAFLKHLSEAFRYGLKVSNCHFCRYHGYDNSYGFRSHKVFCKFFKRNVDNTNEAASCKIYRIDETTFYTEHMNQNADSIEDEDKDGNFP